MNIDPRVRAPVLAIAPLALLLSGCVHEFAGVQPAGAAPWGEANRQTMMLQVVDPDPQYDTLIPPTSGEHAGQAAERYRKDAVKIPDKITSTEVSGGS